METEFKTHFEQNFTTGSYGVGIGRAWCPKKLVKYVVTFSKEIIEKKNSSHKLLNCNRLVFGLKEF